MIAKNEHLILMHPTGNANSRAVLEGAEASGLLSEFHTSVAAFDGNLWSRLAGTPAGREFDRRRFTEQAKSKTHQSPFRELGRMLASRANLNLLTRHETGLFCVDRVYRGIDRKVSRRLHSGGCGAVYAYEDGALETFRSAKNRGITCFYDLPIGHWRTARALLSQEHERWPQWAATMPGFKDSDEKLARKDEELHLADAIFVASSFTASTLQDYPSDLAQTHVIPYGFPDPASAKDFSDLTARKLRMLYVGGLSQRKGIADVFEVADRLGSEVELTVIGRGAVDQCSALASALKRHRWIPSLPHDRVLEQMRQNDILIFPSLFEGFGLVISEAMSQGTPVITTDRTAGADLIMHGQNGWLVPPAHTAVLVKQVETILNDVDRLPEISERCLESAAKRPWSVYGQEVAQRVSELMAAP